MFFSMNPIRRSAKADKTGTLTLMGLLVFFLLLFPVMLKAQDAGEIRGRVFNAINNEPVPFASVLLQGTALGTPSEAEGFFSIKNLKPGEYNLAVSAIGFKSLVVPEVRVQNFKPTV